MAVDIVWTGATSGAMGLATNYTPNQIPGAADNLIFNELVVNAPSTNMTQFDSVRLGIVTVGRGYDLDIGSAANPLEIECDKLVVTPRAGTFHWEPGAVSAATTEVIVNSESVPNAALIIYGGSANADITRLLVVKGFIDASRYRSDIGTLETSYVTSPASDAIVTIGTNTVSASFPIAKLIGRGGIVTLGVTPTDIDWHGPGRLVITSDAQGPPSDLHPILLSGGVIMEYEGDDLDDHADLLFTLTGQPADTETITVDGKVYTFQTVLTDVDGNVLIGATAQLSIANLIAASTLTGTPGTDYALSMTVSATVYFEAGNPLVANATARTAGTAGNSIVVAETVSLGSFAGGGTLLTQGKQIGLLDIVDGVADFNKIANILNITDLRVWPEGEIKRNTDLVTITGTEEDMTGGDLQG